MNAAALILAFAASSALASSPTPSQNPTPAPPAGGAQKSAPQKPKDRQGPPPAKNAPAGSQYALPNAGPDEAPFRGPFRTFLPKKDFELAKGWIAIFADADEMYRIWRDVPGKSFDDDGRPSSRAPHFATLRERLEKGLMRQGAMLRIYRSQANNSARRRAAIFASLFVTPMQDAVHLLRLLPYEPVESLRHESIRLSLPFLEKQVGKSNVDTSGRPSSPRFVFDAAPWIDLTRSKNATDRALALQVLAIIGRARRDAMLIGLPLMRPWINDLLRDEQSAVRNNTREFLTTLEPEARFPEDAEASVAYFARVYEKLFPPIRMSSSGGICELFPSPDLDALVADCDTALRDDRATRVESRTVRKRFGSFDRQGVRLLRITDNMRKAGLDDEMLLTTLDGQPIGSADQLLERLEAAARSKKTKFVLEWVTPKGEERARVYHLRPAEK